MKTVDIFILHNAEQLRSAIFTISEKSLWQLLAISKNSHLCNRIERLWLVSPSNYSYRCLIDEIPEIIKQHFEDERGLENETSSEAFYLLLYIFNKFTAVKSLLSIEIVGGFQAALVALDSSSFDRKIARLRISPLLMDHLHFEEIWDNLRDHMFLVLGVCLDDFYSVDCFHHHNSMQQLYRRLLGLRNIFQVAAGVEQLTIDSCRHHMWRLCSTCTTIWHFCLGDAICPSLTRLDIHHIFVDGYCLRNFLQRHSGTLQKLEFFDIKLVSGSWRDIFFELSQMSCLIELQLAALIQKYTEGTLVQKRVIWYSHAGNISSYVRVLDGNSIFSFLKRMIANFTLVHDTPYRFVDMLVDDTDSDVVILQAMEHHPDTRGSRKYLPTPE
ncbi:hypothetical protein B0J11DRAFT_511843 [Dendryphion nanum]|uniref:Uncharacterized protein n=1 Tax=Dendryphion nanum TaxID=256645 RepID=A0A9P9D4R4_9PLEO|nr:hypothetical protein B0J11DRAFT_511843 [Dendryphion nanum]